jgi:thiol:disulfide interchange protein DsbD
MQREVAFELPAASNAHVAREQPPVRTAGAGSAASADAPPAPTTGLLLALLLAIGGGLILNLMPCVLPVLSMKAISLAESGRSSGHARAHALWYTAGVLISFAAVGLTAVLLRNAGAALGWGFQLQQPGFVAALVIVMTVVGLSLSGVVSFGNSLMGAGQQLTEGDGNKSAFFTGVLAVVVASPCTAPLMFGALGYAFTQPPAISLLVFLALGLGLALPFLLIGFIPALADRLPRPGAWMESFKQWMAFPMYLTAIWLLWVLGKQRGADAMGVVLVACVLLAAAAWWWEKIKYGGGAARRFGIAVVILLSLIGLYAVPYVQQMPVPGKTQTAAVEGELRSEPYSPARLEQLLAAGTPVFVNMTADWCATCKVNESTSLSTDLFQTAVEDTGTVYLKGDWTNSDPEITAFLKRFNAVGVPLYVSYGRKGEPQVLPTVLTPSLAADAVRAAGQR